MKISKCLIIIFIHCIIQNTCASVNHPDAESDTIISRYHQYLLTTFHPDNIDGLLKNIDKSGRWDDLNYNDSTRADWKVSIHLSRLRQLAFNWSDPVSPYYHQEEIWNKISAALEQWYKQRYQSWNWWHNQIGVPRIMRDIIVLMKDNMTGEQLEHALEIMAQFRVLRQGDGANLIWSADLGFHYGVLTKNRELMESCHQRLVNEIHIIETGDGIRPDNSFLQHGERLQMYQYGEAYFVESARLAWQLRETSWQYPAEKVDILSSFVLNGWQWMARGIHTVPGTMDRSVSRVNALHSADIRYLIPYLCELDPARKKQYLEMENIQNGKENLSGFRYYPFADFAVYQQKEFSFFLKTISVKTLPVESINRENLRGHLLNSGDAYFIRNGNEYFNLMPVWDWEKLPGITNFVGSDKIDRQTFTGSIGNGQSGMTVMDYCLTDSVDQAKKLSAKKIWICHNGWVICMLAGLQAEHINPEIRTTIDQSRLQGDIYVDQAVAPIVPGNHFFEKNHWILHNGLITYFPVPEQVILTTGEVEGSWFSINQGGPDHLLKDSVYMPSVVHDLSKRNTLVYALTACKSRTEAEKLTKNLTWSIVSNTQDCQAIQFQDGMKMIAFYKAGSIKTEKWSVQVEQPCLLLINGDNIIAGSPGNSGAAIHVTLNGKAQIYISQ